MEKNDARKAGYRLAARLRGDRLAIDASLRAGMEREFLARIGAIERQRPGDRRALAESVEWERLGDFRLHAGSRTGAVRAYRDAALSCLCGDCYDYDEGLLPHRLLRQRFLALREKMAAVAGDDARLRELIPRGW